MKVSAPWSWLVISMWEIGGVYSTHGRDETCIQDVGRKTRKKETIRKT